MSSTALIEAGGIAVHAGNVLIGKQRRTYGRRSELPSGNLGRGESLQESGVREVRESRGEHFHFHVDASFDTDRTQFHLVGRALRHAP